MHQDLLVEQDSPVLRAVAKPVPKKDIGSPHLSHIIKQMKDALAGEKYGVAIAAPQIGVSLRIFAVAGSVFDKRDVQKPVDGGKKEDSSPDHVYLNPIITRRSRKKKEMSEGCLSVPGKYGTVMRHERVTLDALDEHGAPVHINATGLLGHIFQHECDHLEGVLYIDKAILLEEDEDIGAARVKLKDKHGK